MLLDERQSRDDRRIDLIDYLNADDCITLSDRHQTTFTNNNGSESTIDAYSKAF